MATKNVVPRANGEGELGTSSKQWKKVNVQQITASAGVTVTGDMSASINVSASAFYGEKVFVGELYETGGNREMALGSGVATVFNDFVAGKNAGPDTFSVDRSVSKVAVGYDIADVAALADQFTVSGSTKFGNLSTDTHQFTGSLNVSGAVFAGTENPEETHTFVGRLLVDGAGTLNNSELIVDGPQANYIILNRSSTQSGKIGTDGFRFTLYGNSAFAAQVYDGSTVDEGLFDFAKANNLISGTKHKVNISASVNAFRVDTDEGTNRFNVQNSTTSFVSGSGDLLTMDNTTVPPTPSSAAHIYAKSGEMFVMDTGGNETQISPHDEDGEWQYYSRNVKTGKVVRIRMEKMIRALEKMTGQTFIEEE